MNPLLLTITFLTLMGIITSSQVSHFVDDSMGQQAYSTYVAVVQKREELIEEALFDDFKSEKNPVVENESSIDDFKNEELTPISSTKEKFSDSRSVPLNINRARPPDNARLNLYGLLTDSHPTAHPLYEQTAELLRHLYGKQLFFTQVPRAEYRLLDLLIERKEIAKSFFFPDELGSLEFYDETIQKMFYRMLKGNQGEGGYPSLLYFLSFDKSCSGNQKRINLMFAHPEILRCLIPDPLALAQLIDYRNSLWEEIEYQEKNRKNLPKEACKNRTQIKRELTEHMERIVTEAKLDWSEIKKRFDFTLGKKGSVLFIQDPQTGLVVREKFYTKRNK
ncbi:MAG: hypothetical protein ACKVOH_02060 [Chlamydiales bacterium]